MTLNELVQTFGPVIGILVAFVVTVGGAAVPLAIVIANSRVKVAEARAEAQAAKEAAAAAKELAEAHMVTAMSNLTAALQTQNEGVLRTMAGAIDQMATTLQMMNKNVASSGAAMEVSNTVQAAASIALDASQAKILEDLVALTKSIELLTATIKAQGEVDDEIRSDTLARISRLEEFLSKKVEKAKEKQDEKPNEAAPVQTTVELTGLLTSDVPSGDKPGGGSDK